MTTTSLTETSNTLDQGWDNGAATSDRLNNFLSRQMNKLAINDTDRARLERMSDEDFEAFLA